MTSTTPVCDDINSNPNILEFFVNDKNANDNPNSPIPSVRIKIEKQSDGTLKLTVSIDADSSIQGDLTGLWFDIADNTKYSKMLVQATSPQSTVYKPTGANDVDGNLGNGVVIDPLPSNSASWDVGIKIDYPDNGPTNPPTKTFSFVLSSSNPSNQLTLEDFKDAEFGVRIQSAGTYGSTSGSYKLYENSSAKRVPGRGRSSARNTTTSTATAISTTARPDSRIGRFNSAMTKANWSPLR